MKNERCIQLKGNDLIDSEYQTFLNTPDETPEKI